MNTAPNVLAPVAPAPHGRAAARPLEVRLLGPLDVVVHGRQRPVAGVRRRTILTVLALHPGDVVPHDRLVDLVWADTPPRTARNTVQVHVGHLRRLLGDRSAIRAEPDGYRLDPTVAEVDVTAVEDLHRRALAAADPTTAEALWQAAADRWRGRPLAGAGDTPWIEAHAQRLVGLQVGVHRALAETRCRLGRHHEVIADLEPLTVEHPLDEPLHELLVSALDAVGHRARALAVCDRLRSTLRIDLGIDPGPRLRRLHTEILRGTVRDDSRRVGGSTP